MGLGTAAACRLDLADPKQVIGFWRELDERGLAPQAVVNNAAITGPKTTTADLDLEVLQAVAATNWIGTVLFTREAVRRMSSARGGAGGVIVNVSSTAVRIGAPGQWTHYAALKGALDVFTNGLAREVGAEGIRVNAVSPGYTLTDVERSDEIIGRFERMRHEVPLGRIGTVEEIAAAIHWLCTDDAAYITGAVLPVAGGR
jgi:NAD(P)-dependent dehydrogenase (short-subunit alcohol dehydrogenase family)